MLTVTVLFAECYNNYFYFFFFFYNCLVPMGFLPWEIQVAFPGEIQLQQSGAAQPRVHAGCYGVFRIHRTLTWTLGNGIFSMRTDVNTCDCARGCTDNIRESALKVDSGRKIPCRTGESNLCLRPAGPML